MIVDYRVRGFTRNVKGRKHFIDHKITSVQDFLRKDIQKRYDMVDVNVYQENMYHTKMRLKSLDMDDYLFGEGVDALDNQDIRRIGNRVKHEIEEIFYGFNIPR